MTVEHELKKVMPNPIGEIILSTEGDVSRQDLDLIASTLKKQKQAIHEHYLQLGNRIPSNLPPTNFPVYVRANEIYRTAGNGANTWKYNFILGPTDDGGIIVNAAVINEMPTEHNILLDHEMRHGYLARTLGIDVFGSSFPLREGTAGLCINSTERLQNVLNKGNGIMTLPTSISHWDKSLDKKDTNKRCYINNPWYLGMFSFFHDYIGLKLNMFPRLINTYQRICQTGENLVNAWKNTNPEVNDLESLQKEWINNYDLVSRPNKS